MSEPRTDTDEQRKKDVERLTRENMKLRKREQRMEARLRRSVLGVQKDNLNVESLDLKSLTEKQVRQQIALGNPLIVNAVWKAFQEEKPDIGWRGLSVGERYRFSMEVFKTIPVEWVKARIAERQATLKQADGGFYQLPPTVHVVPKDDVGDISDPAFFADMQRALISESEDHRDEVVRLCRAVLTSAEAPPAVAPGCPTINDEPTGAPLPPPEKPKGLPIDFQTLLPKPEPVKSPVTAGVEGEKLKEQSGVIYRPPIPDIVL